MVYQIVTIVSISSLVYHGFRLELFYKENMIFFFNLSRHVNFCLFFNLLQYKNNVMFFLGKN